MNAPFPTFSIVWCSDFRVRVKLFTASKGIQYLISDIADSTQNTYCSKTFIAHVILYKNNRSNASWKESVCICMVVLRIACIRKHRFRSQFFIRVAFYLAKDIQYSKYGIFFICTNEITSHSCTEIELAATAISLTDHSHNRSSFGVFYSMHNKKILNFREKQQTTLGDSVLFLPCNLMLWMLLVI